MIEFTCRKGGDKEYVEFQCDVLNNGTLIVSQVYLFAFDGKCLLLHMDDKMKVGVQHYCESEYARKQKYKRMEELMLKNLSESVVIENERVYEQCLWEYSQKLEGDERMMDLNGDLKAF